MKNNLPRGNTSKHFFFGGGVEYRNLRGVNIETLRGGGHVGEI